MRFQQKMKRTPLWSLSDPFGKKKAKRQMANQARRDREHAAFLTKLTESFGAQFQGNLKKRQSFFAGLSSRYKQQQKEVRGERMDDISSMSLNRNEVEKNLLQSRAQKRGRKLPMSVRIKGGY
tara:strand:- start:2046 stop:2414 length:369 start_codon:yes stop_codon:yes gene_type:complete